MKKVYCSLWILIIIISSCSKTIKQPELITQNIESEQTEITKLATEVQNTNVNLTINDVANHRHQNGVWPINNAEYLVVSNNVNLRNSPSVDSLIIGSISFPEIVYVMEIFGSNEIINGVLDRWARVHIPSIIDDHATHDIWINCYYIASFPLIISARNKYDTMGISEDDTVSITGYYYNDEKKYFRIAAMLNTHYHNDTTYNIIARSQIQGISILNNSWIRLYNFCDNFSNRLHELSNSWSDSTENSNYIFDYGIKVGMESKLLIETLGSLYATENTTWNGRDAVKYTYSALYIGAGKEVEFIIVDNKVVKIDFILNK